MSSSVYLPFSLSYVCRSFCNVCMFPYFEQIIHNERGNETVQMNYHFYREKISLIYGGNWVRKNAKAQYDKVNRFKCSLNDSSIITKYLCKVN